MTDWVILAVGLLVALGFSAYCFWPLTAFRWVLTSVLSVVILLIAEGYWGHIRETWDWMQKQKMVQELAKKFDTSPDEQQRMIGQLVTDLKQRLSLTPDDFQGHLLLAKLYMMQNQLDPAIEIYHRFFKAHPNHVELLTRYARALYERDHLFSPIAETLIKQAKALFPDHLDVLALSALDALQNKDDEQAEADWTRMANLTSDPQLKEKLLRQVEKLKLRRGK